MRDHAHLTDVMFYTDKPSPNAFALGYAAADVTLYFSFGTLVAFKRPSGLVVHENAWGTATARHLDAIDGGTPEARAARLDAVAFDRELMTTLWAFNLLKPRIS